MRRLAPILALLLALPDAGAAQDITLDDVEAFLASGQYATARQAIDAWWQRADDPGAEAAVRAHLLRGRLALDPVDADADYLAVALGYPSQTAAAEALLRLGQSLLLRGEVARAQGYLQRLVADYPDSRFHGPGTLWLARAYNAGDRQEAACRVAREGIAAASGTDLAALLRLEEAASCRLTAGPDPETPAPAAQAEPETPPEPAADSPAGNFAVQAGAFRQREGARVLAERLRDAGHEPRLVLVPHSSLLRVRIGRFASAQEAGDLVRRLRNDGFSAIVVADAHRERRP